MGIGEKNTEKNHDPPILGYVLYPAVSHTRLWLFPCMRYILYMVGPTLMRVRNKPFIYVHTYTYICTCACVCVNIGSIGTIYSIYSKWP